MVAQVSHPQVQRILFDCDRLAIVNIYQEKQVVWETIIDHLFDQHFEFTSVLMQVLYSNYKHNKIHNHILP